MNVNDWIIRISADYDKDIVAFKKFTNELVGWLKTTFGKQITNVYPNNDGILEYTFLGKKYRIDHQYAFDKSEQHDGFSTVVLWEFTDGVKKMIAAADFDRSGYFNEKLKNDSKQITLEKFHLVFHLLIEIWQGITESKSDFYDDPE